MFKSLDDLKSYPVREIPSKEICLRGLVEIPEDKVRLVYHTVDGAQEFFDFNFGRDFIFRKDSDSEDLEGHLEGFYVDSSGKAIMHLEYGKTKKDYGSSEKFNVLAFWAYEMHVLNLDCQPSRRYFYCKSIDKIREKD